MKRPYISSHHGSPPPTTAHWRPLRRALPTLKAMGIDSIWIPSGCKGANPSGNGYDIYDLYDLGEFDQKGSQSTRWGTKDELLGFTSRVDEFGIGIYRDAVLNQKAGAGCLERYPAVEVDPQDRNIGISDSDEIEGWYSPLKYNWSHFSGVDWDDSRKQKFKATLSDGKFGSLLYYLSILIPKIREIQGHRFFFVGKYRKGEIGVLLDYLERMDYQLALFSDIYASNIHGALVQKRPEHAVAFLTSSFTKQPGQSLEESYAVILPRYKGQPCLFYRDLYGIEANSKPSSVPPYAFKLSTLAQARKLYANRAQRGYFDGPNRIGFVRYGNARHPSGLACILSNAGPSRKRMYLGRAHSGQQWTDILNSRTEAIKISRKYISLSCYHILVLIKILKRRTYTQK
ncbi:glycoside hydrolase superfamily [Aspergillus pseudoustus]|uniref:Glycoside hydrolase superfamily n=1 Tax=Aspergillus pseudoustus TaxID=1810923 RepID=A0ABR4JFS5_9EURO